MLFESFIYTVREEKANVVYKLKLKMDLCRMFIIYTGPGFCEMKCMFPKNF